MLADVAGRVVLRRPRDGLPRPTRGAFVQAVQYRLADSFSRESNASSPFARRRHPSERLDEDEEAAHGQRLAGASCLECP